MAVGFAFMAVLFVAAVGGGAIAAVAGFGIGSVMTPLLALEVGTRLAVAAVAIPHAVGTAQRLWLLRAHVDRRILLGFGLTSALGGLAGAVLQSAASGRGLAIVFGLAVGLAGIAELTGWVRRVRWGRRAAWVAGLVSGLLGGMVGNQGGIRAAAMLGFGIPRESFVATATAIGLFVDAARLPVYLATQGAEILALWPVLVVATVGVVIGTALGTRILGGLDERWFHRILGVALVGIGVWIGAQGS
jgi:uncharacterized membrane protein YfcA